MAKLDNVNGPGGSSDEDAESEEETTCHELADAVSEKGGALNDGAHGDDG